MKFPYTTRILGTLLMLFSFAQIFPGFLAYFFEEREFVYNFIVTGFVTFLIGCFLFFLASEKNGDLRTKDGFIITIFFWTVLGFFGSIPFYLAELEGVSYIDSLFESISGLTTTGATVLVGLDEMPRSLLFYRQLLQWLGGMGIIVLAIAILPFLGIGGTQLFSAEAPGPASDKLHPRITDTAKRLWLIYLTYTILQTILLYSAGMTIFDAVNHAMSTISTGGFSTKSESIAFWNDKPLIQYIIIIFMFLAGTNFVLSYFAFTRKFQKIFQDEEFKLYSRFIIFFSLLVIIFILLSQNLPSDSFLNIIEPTIRNAIFQVVSIITTTGFVTYDFTQWAPIVTIIFFGLMFLGGSSGSTSGGVKIVRHMLMIKTGFLEFKRALHPNAIIQSRYNNKTVSESISFNILGFFILYMLSFIVIK